MQTKGVSAQDQERALTGLDLGACESRSRLCNVFEEEKVSRQAEAQLTRFGSEAFADAVSRWSVQDNDESTFVIGLTPAFKDQDTPVQTRVQRFGSCFVNAPAMLITHLVRYLTGATDVPMLDVKR
jgi:hypothetical protein